MKHIHLFTLHILFNYFQDLQRILSHFFKYLKKSPCCVINKVMNYGLKVNEFKLH